MGYRGKVQDQERARELRALGHTYSEIVATLGVSKSSVSLWCRDVVPDAEAWARRARANRTHGARLARPHAQQVAKQAEIARLRHEGKERIGRLSDQEFLVAGVALYAGEGAKRDGEVVFVNSDPRMVEFFVAWLRRCFEIDEERLRMRLYLHQGLELRAAIDFWSGLTAIPEVQFRKPYRAAPDPSIRRAKHAFGCASVSYSSTSVHREVMGLVHGLLSVPEVIPG